MTMFVYRVMLVSPELDNGREQCDMNDAYHLYGVMHSATLPSYSSSLLFPQLLRLFSFIHSFPFPQYIIPYFPLSSSLLFSQ